jgi:hypothetical protein
MTHTASAIPALIRVKNNGGLPLFRIRDHDIHLTDVHTHIASIADIRIEHYRCAGRTPVWKGIYFFFGHVFLLVSVHRFWVNPVKFPKGNPI